MWQHAEEVTGHSGLSVSIVPTDVYIVTLMKSYQFQWLLGEHRSLQTHLWAGKQTMVLKPQRASEEAGGCLKMQSPGSRLQGTDSAGLDWAQGSEFFTSTLEMLQVGPENRSLGSPHGVPTGAQELRDQPSVPPGQ